MKSLEKHLQRHPRNEVEAPGAIRCAVLVPLIRHEEGWQVLYTKRSEDLPDHKGQVAFPGGKRSDEDTSLVETALREANEEVGIEAGDVRVLGALDDIHSMNMLYHVTPYVGVLDGMPDLTPNPAEVADVFHVPVEDLQDPARRGEQEYSWKGNRWDVDVIRTQGHTIWGVTLSITMNLLERLEADRS